MKSFGSASDESALQVLVSKAENWIRQKSGLQEFDFSGSDSFVEQFFNSISSIERTGYDLLIGPIFDEIGFGKIDNEFFRELVIARVGFPKSKLKTAKFLYRYKNIAWDEDKLYRYLDKLYNTQKEAVQQISFEHTLKVMDHDISVVFYDVTTLYFEIDEEDDLRKTGFSKEGKHQNPQIVLGLLVSKGGYPLAYEIFSGNKFEGHTMLPVIDGFKEKFKLDKLVVVADSGLFSNENIIELQEKGYEFIIGARIKNEKENIKQKILSLNLENGKSEVIPKGDLKLIITYSDKRAKKDKYNREKGIKKLGKRIKTGRLTKSSINNRGYNKFLKLDGQINVNFDLQKIEEDIKWDGLKGYLSNAKLNKNQIVENYQHLWQIEKAFRIAKTDLKIRPIYHRLQRRIEAHICISFTAYKVYKELERQLTEKKATISAGEAIEIADYIHQITINLPQSGKTVKKTILNTEEQRYLADLFNFGC
ncbi:MAG: IS1634 family transposase [Ginsengibacter sp.]